MQWNWTVVFRIFLAFSWLLHRPRSLLEKESRRVAIWLRIIHILTSDVPSGHVGFLGVKCSQHSKLLRLKIYFNYAYLYFHHFINILMNNSFNRSFFFRGMDIRRWEEQSGCWWCRTRSKGAGWTFFPAFSPNPSSNTLTRLSVKLQGDLTGPTFYEIHKKEEIFRQQLKKHRNFSNTFADVD